MSKLGIVTKEPTVITVEELKKVFPKRKESITEELVEIVNEANTNPFFSNDEFMETVLTYRDVMEKNKASIKDYLVAIKFCAYLESEDYNITEAFKKSHSHRDFVKDRWDVPTNSKEYKELTSAASRYRQRSPLVRQILTQSQIGLHLMFQGETYRAVNVLSDIMVNGKSEIARVAAAKELLANVKPPENTKIELDIGIKNNEAMMDLTSQLAEFATNSIELLKSGNVDLKVLGAMRTKQDENIIDGEIEDVTNK